jgi:hypothetical protein
MASLSPSAQLLEDLRVHSPSWKEKPLQEKVADLERVLVLQDREQQPPKK